jgi:hypothetical protein
MSAELMFFNTLLPVVGQMANSPNRQLAAVAAEEHAKLAAKVAKLKRAEADAAQAEGATSAEAGPPVAAA